MSHAHRIAASVLALIIAGTRAAPAQIDYRNLDDGRPVRSEDAYPIERYAFELLIPYEYENARGGEQVHAVVPELSYGIAANTQLGLELPLAVRRRAGDSDWGLAGPRLFVLHNLNTESRSLPAFAVRADVALPFGSLAGNDPRLTFKGIATRSWGLTRLHLNAAITPGSGGSRPEVDAEPRWMISLAADRTLLRQSLLLVGELHLAEAGAGSPTGLTASLGLRYQLTPTLVLDGGLSRRLTSDAGPDLGLTLGLSHAFALPGLMPRLGRM